MFRQANAQNTRRAIQRRGNISPLTVPNKGMNARDTLARMSPEYAINLTNVIVDPYGVRTRKGYTEWARNLPGPTAAVPTVMSYYPATANPVVLSVLPMLVPNFTRMLVEPRGPTTPPAGKLFAAANNRIYDVTPGGLGAWVAQVGVVGLGNYWTWINYQNIAGSFLAVTNELGGYAYYNGSVWATPIQGTAAGQIEGVDPAKLCHVMAFKKRLWFVEKDSTRAWYLPVSQITGKVTSFDFGEQFPHGGHLAELENWTVDGGVGVDDYLIAISSQGDVVVYKGTDPNSAADFALHGVWYVGALPNSRRCCVNTGGDIHILSHYGITPLSILLAAKDMAQLEQGRLSYLISPLIARLMRDYATLPGWQINMIPKEELMLIRVPQGALDFGGQFLALKLGTGAWCVLKDLPYTDFVSIDSAVFAGTNDSRVVRAFDGPLDNVLIGQKTGLSIQCVVTPAFQSMGTPGQQKVFKLIRPTFITTFTPSLEIQILTDYGPPKASVTPTLPDLTQSYWDEDRWDVAKWSGIQEPITEWLGCHGVGFAGTSQLNYKTGGDTVLASIDFWTEAGGVM